MTTSSTVNDDIFVTITFSFQWSWWHQTSSDRVNTRSTMTSSMETFSALLVLCEGNSPVPDEFPSRRPVTRSFGSVFFYLCLNKRLRKQAGDLRRHRAHYDVTVMRNWSDTISFMSVAKMLTLVCPEVGNYEIKLQLWPMECPTPVSPLNNHNVLRKEDKNWYYTCQHCYRCIPTCKIRMN